MKLINDDGQPNYGRFEHLPMMFNVQDYKNPFLTSAWKRRLRYKKFSFISIQHQQYTLGLAIADLSWVGHGFYYCYDRKTQKVIDFHALQPLARQTVLQDVTQMHQPSFFKHSAMTVRMQEQDHLRKIHVERKGQLLCDAQIIMNERQPLYLCSPNGIRGWTFTHKSMCLAVQGRFLFNDEYIQFGSQTLASLDDSCGFLRPETEWFWLSGQFHLNDKKIAINLASGVNESCGNENCLWIDGHLIALTDVIFRQNDAQSWSIFSLDQSLHFTVKTGWRRFENINLGIVASQFSQWISVLDGYVDVDGQKLVLNQVDVLLEQHYAKW